MIENVDVYGTSVAILRRAIEGDAVYRVRT